MSWDFELLDDLCCPYGEWNYTSNVGPMVALALHDLIDPEPDEVLPVGWDSFGALGGLPGPEGAAWLHRLIVQLESDPARYEALNPPNGWGDYDSLLALLREMRAAVPERPMRWSVTR